MRWAFAAIALVLATPIAQAQTVLFNSNGFESPTFATGMLGTYYGGGSGGQQSYLTTDFNQLLGTPAGTIQTGTVQSGAQAFQINGSRLYDDSTFGGQSFWYRNYPTATTAFNPTGSNVPIVRVVYNQYVSSTPLDVADMPLVGIYMEGYAQGSGTQQQVGSLLLNQNGGITAITAAGNSISTTNGLYTHDAWHNMEVDFNFSAQTYEAFLDGVPVTFGASLVNVPFRNTNGPTDRIAEYGFEASYNEATMSTTNNAYFDNYSIVATGVPEPSSFVLGAVALVGVRLFRRRK
jgi:hypothetical protein